MKCGLFNVVSLLLVVSLWLAPARIDAADQPTIELQSAGDAPRREMRYQYKAGDTQTMVMLMDMNMAAEVNGQPTPSFPIPTQRMEMTVAVERVTEDDKLQCRFEMTAVDLVEDPDAPSSMAGQMREMLKTMVGLGGTYTQSRRGQVTDVAIEYPEGINPMVRQSMGNMEQVMGQSAAPLPQEPVGVGAVWSVEQTMDTLAFSFDQKATYTVIALTENGATLSVAVEQSAEPQDMNIQGASMRLTEFQGRGEGEMTIDFGNVVPHVRTSVTSINQIETVANGQPMKMRTNMGMTMTLAPKADE